MRGFKKAIACMLCISAGLAAGAGGAMAEIAQPWQMDLQEPATPIMESMISFHNMLLVIIGLITLFVTVLLVWAAFRYRESANPVPSKTSHNTMIEVLWTVVPVLILVVIAIPSFRLLYAQHSFPQADLVIKAIGRQWYWSYEYPEQGNFTFDSYMVEDADLKPGQPRLLTVDNQVVVPVNKVVHVLVTASDVVHNWTIPAFGSKIDAVPGRVNRTWFMATKPGVYYGQCSELCGTRHAFMPIAVRVVSDEEFARWTAEAKEKFASVTPAVPAAAERRLASAD